MAKDDIPAFPVPNDANVNGQEGMSLRDYFAIHAPIPHPDVIATEQGSDRSRNPHNDSYKPALRSRLQIESELRYRFADAMLAARGDSA